MLAVGAATALIDEVEAENLDAIFLVVVLFVPWCLGAYNDVRRAIVGLIAVEAAFLWVNLQSDNGIGDYFWIGAFGAVAWTGGFILNRRTEHARELAERSQRWSSSRRRRPSARSWMSGSGSRASCTT